MVADRPGARPGGDRSPIRLLADPNGRVAEDFGLRRPSDGGYPVGYVIVAPDVRIRYRTLDPKPVHDLFEVQIMLRALK